MVTTDPDNPDKRDNIDEWKNALTTSERRKKPINPQAKPQ